MPFLPQTMRRINRVRRLSSASNRCENFCCLRGYVLARLDVPLRAKMFGLSQSLRRISSFEKGASWCWAARGVVQGCARGAAHLPQLLLLGAKRHSRNAEDSFLRQAGSTAGRKYWRIYRGRGIVQAEGHVAVRRLRSCTSYA